jgi:GPI ethanolamine phosphate transferase 2/3 subunit F
MYSYTQSPPLAPVFDHYEETFTLSALLTSLTLFPVSIFVGVSGTVSLLATDSYELANIVSQSYLKLLKRNAILVTVGAYIASVVFPLDWERK